MSATPSTIVIGLSGRESDKKLLKIAVDLCEKLSKKLHLVHCYEPNEATYASLLGDKDLTKVFEGSDAAYEKSKKDYLKGIADNLQITASYSVVAGAKAPSLVSEAQISDGFLILVGARSKEQQDKNNHSSLAVSLFNCSNIPVMVINEKISDKWQIDSFLRVVCADDLDEERNKAAPFAAQLVHLYDNNQKNQSELNLIHVNPLSKSLLESSIDLALTKAHVQPTASINPEKIYQNFLSSMKENLDKRIPKDLQEKISFQSQVIDGHCERELASIIQNQFASIAVFGKHRAVHRKPFYFGKLPFATAFELDTPFIIVPG